MKTIFSGLPNDIIISIIRIDNDRRKSDFLNWKILHKEVVKQLNKITTMNEFCPSIRSTFNIGGEGLSISEIWMFAESTDTLGPTTSSQSPAGGGYMYFFGISRASV